MAAAPKRNWTAEEYLEFERTSMEKHEFLDGEVYLMVGASEDHNVIAANTIIALGIQLRGRPCKIYPSDMRVRISGKNYTYPDVTIVCGTPEFEDSQFDTLLNPTVIIEVLSASTEKYDRTTKFQEYRMRPSLQEYVLISQDKPRIEHYKRQDNNQWLLTDFSEIDAVVELSSIGCTLALVDVYDKVTFDAETNV